jgi:hypothetical protein
MEQYGPSDLNFGGPGAPPGQWVTVSGGVIGYDGAVLIPLAVPGGNMGPGTLNVNDIYIKGIQLEAYVGQFLPLSGGTLTGSLTIPGSRNFFLGDGAAGQGLTADGAGGVYWSLSPPGGPYLKLTGGDLTGHIGISAPSNFVLGGGTAGQVLSTDGNANLSWINPGGAGSLPPAGPIGYILATDGGTAPYWTNVLPGGPYLTVASGPYAPAVAGGYLALSGGTLTGALQLAADPTTALGAVTKQYSDLRVLKSGDTMTGPLVLSGDPIAALNPTTKQYVDNKPIGLNRLINGDMAIDQRNNGAGGSTLGYTCDRWNYSATTAGKFTWQRTTASVPDFPYCFGFTSTSAYALIASDYFVFGQPIEADNISDFAWGTANAKTVTLSFWVNSSLIGTFSGSIRNTAAPANRSYPFTYSIPVAGTWTKIVITIPGDTAGVWVLTGNAGGLSIYFSLGTGATFSAPANTWAAGNFLSANGAVNVVSTNAASFYITGVKLESGAIATPYPRETMSKRFADCQRYYQQCPNGMFFVGGWAGAGATYWCLSTLPTKMRANPTATSTPTYVNASALTFTRTDGYIMLWSIIVTAAGMGYANTGITLNAEL